MKIKKHAVFKTKLMFLCKIEKKDNKIYLLIMKKNPRVKYDIDLVFMCVVCKMVYKILIEKRYSSINKIKLKLKNLNKCSKYIF